MSRDDGESLSSFREGMWERHGSGTISLDYWCGYPGHGLLSRNGIEKLMGYIMCVCVCVRPLETLNGGEISLPYFILGVGPGS
jgi:hypothetical protein